MLFKAYCVIMLFFLGAGLLYGLVLMFKEYIIDDKEDDDWEQ